MLWTTIRTVLYAVAIASGFLTFVLAAAFVGRTNNDFDVYNKGSAELIAASLLLLLTLPVLHFFLHRRKNTSVLASVAVEIGVVFVLWCLILGGAAAMSDQLGGLTWCDGSICSLGRSVQAFAWICWISLTLLIAYVVASALVAQRKGQERVWTSPLDPSHVQIGSNGTRSTRPDATTQGKAAQSSTSPTTEPKPNMTAV
ncbi:hypothetical protein JCM10212_001153 [Sporobolomyces blumeae]